MTPLSFINGANQRYNIASYTYKHLKINQEQKCVFVLLLLLLHYPFLYINAQTEDKMVNRSRLEKVQSFVSVGVNINTIACAQIKLLTTLCSKKGT